MEIVETIEGQFLIKKRNKRLSYFTFIHFISRKSISGRFRTPLSHLLSLK